MMTILTILGVSLISLAIWALICNQRTYKQRRLIYPKYGEPDYWEKRRKFKSVDYGTHHITLMMFKDAKELYK